MPQENAWTKIATSLDINLDNVIVTYKTSARVLLSIIEFLSYNRNQIPLVYETFNHMVHNLEKHPNDEGDSEIGVNDLAVERQREIAIRTNRKFHEISDILIKSFKKMEIEQAVIVFGATSFTAKEAFVVNLPEVCANHLPENHTDSPQIITRKVLMSIITSTQFFDVNFNQLKPTNMFVFLKPKHIIDIEHHIDNKFQRHDHFKLPSHCRITMLNIKNDLSKISLNCCQKLCIFDDFDELININSSDTSEKTDQMQHKETEITKCAVQIESESETIKCSATSFSSDFQSTTTQRDPNHPNSTISSFYECNISVKGFKDRLIKGKSIWIH